MAGSVARAPFPPVRGHRLGISVRFMLGLTALLVVVIGGITVQSNLAFEKRSRHELNVDLQEEVPEYQNAASVRPAGEPLATFVSAYLRAHDSTRHHMLIVALTPTGSGASAPVFSTPAAALLRSAPQVRAWITDPPTRRVMTDLWDGTGHYRILASPLTVKGVHEGTLFAAYDLALLNQSVRNELRSVVEESAAALALAILGGYLLLRRLLRVIGQVTTTAQDIAAGDLSRRLNFQGPDDELGRLARTVDGMLDRLEAAFGAQRQLLSDVSHQLRTPLTVIRGHLDVLNRSRTKDPAEVSETVALVIDELDQLALLVERLLLLGKALEQDFITDAPLAVRNLLVDVLDAARFLGPRDWQLGAVPDAVVVGDRAKLRGALLNLVDNAVRATEPGQRVRLEAQQRPDGGLVLQVNDNGRGMASEDREEVLGRFVRTRAADYRGSGLGLPIARAVAEAHGGRLELTSTLGLGCSVRIVLPAWRVTRSEPAQMPTCTS